MVFLALVLASVALGADQDPGKGRYVVVLEDSIEDPGAVGREQMARYGGTLGFVYRHGLGGYSAFLPPAALEALERDPRVKSITPDQPMESFAQTPSTGLKRVYALANTALKIDEAANFTVNADVAVIDGGFKAETDLNVVKRMHCDGPEKGEATCAEGGDDEANGHGTRVASIVGAIDNTIGVVGVAPGVRLWSIKIFDPNTFESEAIAAVDYVISKASEIEVVNMSVGCNCAQPNLATAIGEAVEAGVVFVAAAGNTATSASLTSPANIASVITVSGVADYDGLAGAKAATAWVPSCNTTKQAGDTEQVGADDTSYKWSNWGTIIDIAAPAVCIQSLMPGGTVVYSPHGTSLAAPQVAGAAAILAAQSNPNSAADVEKIAKTIKTAGETSFTDNSKDMVQEAMLSVKNETLFK